MTKRNRLSPVFDAHDVRGSRNGNKKQRMPMFIILLFTVIFTASVFGTGAQALSNQIIVRVNGILLQSDTEAFIHEDRTYIPLRAVAEALDSDVSYEEDTQTAIIYSDTADIRMPVGSSTATVNGLAVQIPAPSILVNNRVMVPLRFVSEALDSQVTWFEGFNDVPNIVNVNSPSATTTQSGIGISSLYYSVYHVLEDFGDYQHTVSAEAYVPQFHGFDDVEFQESLNEEFHLQIAGIESSMESAYQEYQDEPDSFYGASEDCTFNIQNEQDKVITLQLSGYMYFGGAHGLEYISTYMIDLNQSKVLVLEDLFQPGADYEAALIREINNLRASGLEDFEDLEDVTEFPEEFRDFYFEDGNLMIYFPPYALASYARGHVEFPIPLENIADILL